MMPPADVLMEAVAEAARLAGDTALRHFRRGITVEWKPDGTEVTSGDRASESAVRAWIESRFPDDDIIGEEFGYVQRGGTRTWYVDPIDGTRSFVRGVPLWGSMVAVAVDGVVRAGAINCAAVGEFVVAAVGSGCWLNGVRTGVSPIADLPAATVLATDTTFPSHPERASRWAALSRHAATARTWGDCYGYVLVASGRAEAMADDRLNPWDVAALLPIIAEAGGSLTDWAGHVRTLGPDGLATNAVLAMEIRAQLGIPSPTASPT